MLRRHAALPLTAGTVFVAAIWLGESLPTPALVIGIPVTQLITASEVQRRTTR